MLTPHGVLPIALGDNWIYALPTDDGVLMMDAGPDYEGAWGALLAQLDAGGLRLADVRAVVISHAHIDHCGLAARWQAEGVPVAGSAVELEGFRQGDRVIGYQSELVFAEWERCGVPRERVDAFVERRRHMRAQAAAGQGPQPARERWPGLLRGTPFIPDRTFTDGERFSLGGRRFVFAEAPGHTPGNAVLHEPASGALFSGDQLIPGLTPTPGMHFTSGERPERMHSLPAFARSMRKIRALGATYLYPGHGEHTPNLAEEIDRTLFQHQKRQDRLLRFLRDGPLTPYELLLGLFPHLPDRRLWQAMAEIVGHVDALVERGDAAREAGPDGTERVRAQV